MIIDTTSRDWRAIERWARDGIEKARDMTDFNLLLACYRSGQISERQWQEHIKDEVFRAWLEKQEARTRAA